MRHWPIVAPLFGVVLLGAAAFLPPHPVLLIVLCAALVGAVLAAVHHAEVVAHRLGEPLGTLVLALAVTVIEAGLILALMLSGGPASAALARDTVYAAVMIICNGVVGLCVLVGGLRHREQAFRVEGASPALEALVALATLTLVLPSFTTSAPGGAYAPSQLVFAGVCSLALWGVFVFAQTVRHRDYFLPPLAVDDDAHLPPPSVGAAAASGGLLVVSLVAVVGLAKALSPTIEAVVQAAGVPDSVVGVAIALLVLLPETLAAVRAAAANRLQTSMNLALGSALASIGLTIPAVASASLLLGIPVVLGLDPKDLVLLALTFVVAAITFGPGRTSIMKPNQLGSTTGLPGAQLKPS